MATAELERRPLTPLDIGETKAAQKLYQDGLTQLLDRAEDVTPIKGRGGKIKNHVNRSGVSKITTWCSLSTTLVGTPEIDRDENGKALRWRVTVRAAAPDGRVADGVGAFSLTERPVSKPEHDGLGTAYTRARNRAVMDLVGMGEVSAEEIVAGADTEGTTLPYGPPADATLRTQAERAIATLWPDIPGSMMVAVLERALGDFPEISARTILGLAWFLDADDTTRAAAAGVTEPAPAPRSGPEFDDMVPPAEPVDNSTVGVELDDEVDVDAIFGDDAAELG